MKDRESFLLKLCVALFVCCAGLSLVAVMYSCSSSRIEVSKEVCNG